MEFNKKAISPVVATALLLVVAVVAVVGFQTWFTTYQSGIEAQVEQDSQTGVAVGIDRLEASGTVYLTNSGNEDVNITSINIETCDYSSQLSYTLTPGTSSIDADTPCGLTEGTSEDVVVVTDDQGVFSATQIVR